MRPGQLSKLILQPGHSAFNFADLAATTSTREVTSRNLSAAARAAALSAAATLAAACTEAAHSAATFSSAALCAAAHSAAHLGSVQSGGGTLCCISPQQHCGQPLSPMHLHLSTLHRGGTLRCSPLLSYLRAAAPTAGVSPFWNTVYTSDRTTGITATSPGRTHSQPSTPVVPLLLLLRCPCHGLGVRHFP